MPEPLKNIYNQDFFSSFLSAFKKVVPSVNPSFFMEQVYKDNWNELELKQRMRRVTEVLHAFLNQDFKTDIKILLDLIPQLYKAGFRTDMLEFIFLPDYIAYYGLEHYKVSLNTIERMTQFITCEFAIRPFLIKYPDKTLTAMINWSEHPHPGVRRLASEGTRPRLPWALGVPELKKEPQKILPILENLKDDPSETVRRSVANNLNDISKDHPTMVIDIARSWIDGNPNRKKLVKHACRTLLKQGNKEMLKLYGFHDLKEVEIVNFHLHTPRVEVGKSLEFSFEIENNGSEEALIRLEYALHYLKSNGRHYKKVFKISEKVYPPDSISKVVKNHSFRIITTRKYYRGEHFLSLIMNGQEHQKCRFELI